VLISIGYFYGMMEQEELKRFDRALAILILLQSKKLVKAQELAQRFAVSLRTIYRDIRSLEAAGVPIIGEAGAGYSIMEGYRLPPVMFTKEEAASFIAAEKLMQKFTDASLGAYFESAMSKVKAVLRGSEKDWIAAVENQIWAAPKPEIFQNTVPNALEILFNSIAEQKQVLLGYRGFAAEDALQRFVEPVGLVHENDYWYLFAYCHLRNDYRQFRTDRIVSIRSSTESFTQKHPHINDLRKCSDNVSKTRVVIAVKKDIVRYIATGRKYYGFVSEKVSGDEVEMVFETIGHLDGLARWYMMFGDAARIIEPESFQLRVKELTEKTRENLAL